MAALGGIESTVNGMPDTIKARMLELVRALVPFLRFGPVEHQSKAENFASYCVVSTTATSTSEFSILHGLGRAPYRAMPVLDLHSSGMELVPLRVTRPADASRIYLKTAAGSTGTVFSLQIE